MRFLGFGLAMMALGACGSDDRAEPVVEVPSADDCCTITITADVPEGTPAVYLTGNLDALGPWSPTGLLMSGDGGARTVTFTAPKGFDLEYKFTLGRWENEALGPSGTIMNNRLLTVTDTGQSAHTEVPDFRADSREYIADIAGSGVKGTLIYWTDVESAFLGPKRHVEVWLPPGYDETADQRYPVIYMSDGQNLFDPRIANTGMDWGVDEAIVSLTVAGLIDPTIVVASWSTEERAPEYSPWHKAPNYARFIKEELKPRVDAEFRTLPGRETTFHMGSSMGGLLSFYMVREHSDTFSACGCLSTHVPLSEAVMGRLTPMAEPVENPDTTPYLQKDLKAGITLPANVRLWFDYGTLGLDAGYGPGHTALEGWLVSQRLVDGKDYVVRRYDGADHNERSWRARLKDPLTFLLAPLKATKTD